MTSLLKVISVAVLGSVRGLTIINLKIKIT